MKKQKARITYDPSRDEYRLEIFDPISKEWGLDMAARFFKREGDTNADCEYVHFSLVKELANLLNNGFVWERSL